MPKATGLHDRAGVSREEVIAAIYEAVIRPACFGAFLDVWRDHIAEALADPLRNHDRRDGADGVEIDPELAAHFSRAHEILDRLGRSLPDTSLADRVSRSDGFVLLVDGDGRIRAAGAAARVELGGASRIEALENLLVANSLEPLRELRASLHRGVQEDEPASPLVLATGIQPRHLIARVEPGEDPLLAIEALDFQWSDRAGQMLVDSFGLSPAEVGIVRNLMAGLSLREIAARTAKSEHTVRNQAKAVLAKTGAPGQVDLIRLVAFLIKAGARGQSAAVGRGPLRSELVEMATGLKMQVLHGGVEDGRPVLFLHGMQDGVSPIEALNDRFARRGYRVIAPVRPGFAQSSAAPTVSRAMTLFTAHVAELIDRLHLRQPLILGHMAGAIYGHVLTGALRDRVAGMVGVSGAVPIIRASDMATMAPHQRAAAYTARYAPALLPFVLRIGIAQIDSRDFDTLLEGLFRPGTHDNEVLHRLDLSGWIRSGYRFSVQQSYAGFAADAHHAVRDWRRQVPLPAAPVILLHGDRDPVVTPRMARTFANGRDNIDLRIVPETAQLMLYEHPDIVLDALDELSGRGKDKDVLSAAE